MKAPSTVSTRVAILITAIAVAVCCISLHARRELFIAAAKISPKVLGGYTTKGAWPWYVQVFGIDKNGKIVNICGGVLISPDKVLTAAHCNNSKNISSFMCIVGWDNNRTKYEEIGSIRYTPHEKYNPSSLDYLINRLNGIKQDDHTSRLVDAYGFCDIAIITLSRPARYDLTPITLARGRSDKSPLAILGRGTTDRRDVKLMPNFNRVPMDLQTIVIDGKTVGQSVFRGSFVLPPSSKRAYSGDSGGPAVVEVSTGVFHLFGIFNKNIKDGTTVFASVPYYLGWIKKHAPNARVAEERDIYR